MQYARLFRYTGLGLLATVLVCGPFFKGLFFWTELLVGIAIVTAGYGLWALGRRLANLPYSVSGGAPGIGLLVLLLCYILQFAWAVYTRGNLDWVLRVAAGYLAFVMARAEAGPALRRVLGWLLVFAAAGLAVPGFLEYTGFFSRNEAMTAALSIVNLQDRMATLLQYPNTAAIFLTAAVLVAVGLAVERRTPVRFAILAGLISLISLAFFFTVSRGAVVALPFGLVLLLLGLDKERGWDSLVLLGAAWAPALAVLKPIGNASAASATTVTFGWIALAVFSSALLGLAATLFLRLRWRIQFMIIGGALLLAAGTVSLVRPDAGLLPKQAERLLDMNFRTGNVLYRLQLDQDALKMISDRPLGRGGWGWDRSYHQYQSTHYIGRETHNHYLQTGVEAGIPGLLVLVGTIGMAIWLGWLNRKGEPVAWSLAAAAGLIAGHSLIDFNLSYGAIWFWFWVLLAASTKPVTTKEWGGRPGRLALVGVTLGLTAVSTILALGSWQTDRAERWIEGEKRDQATSAARLAAKLDPLNSAPLLVIDDRPSLERAARLDPQNAQVHWQLAVLLPNQHDWEGALVAARAAVESYPLETQYHTKLFTVAGNLMVSALHDGDLDRAREVAAELRHRGDALTAEMVAQRSRSGSWMRNKLSMTPELKLRYGQALFLTGAQDQAEPLLKEAAVVGLLDSEADIWLYVLYQRRGDTKGMTSLEPKPWIRFRNVNPVYRALSQW